MTLLPLRKQKSSAKHSFCAVRDTKTTGADTFDYCELIT